MVLISSSVIPSAKYSSFWSGLMLEKGRIAILVLGEEGASPADGWFQGRAILNTSIGKSTFLRVLAPMGMMGKSNLFLTWACTGWDMQIPPGSASGSIREAMLTASP